MTSDESVPQSLAYMRMIVTETAAGGGARGGVAVDGGDAGGDPA